MKPIAALAVLSLAFVTSACGVVQETGRRQLTFFSTEEMNTMGIEAYDQATSEYPIIRSGAQYRMVQEIGRRIAAASGRDYDWEFRLLDAPETVNAFALPGGKVAVYTGLLRVTQNEDALAAVMGHEVAHATSNHGNERMTQQMMANGLMAAGDLALASWGNMSEDERSGWMTAFATGTNLAFLLPYSREHESEADEIGLRFLIRAGYDPHEAPKLWERMAALSGPDRTPEFQSTHPDPLARAARLRELIPKILAEERGGS